MTETRRVRKIESVWIAAILLVVIVASFFAANLLASRTNQTGTIQSDHVNVRVNCGQSLPYLADHNCVAGCPVGYGPGHWFVPSPPGSYSGSPCMTSDNRPVSIYDLAGLQVSPDNGKTTYQIVSDVPMAKVLVMGTDQQAYWTLQVSPTVVDSFATYAAIPPITTQIGTIGDQMSTFNILRIDPASLTGNKSTLYPVGTCCTTITIHTGDDVGIACEGLSEKLAWIDYPDQVAAFTVTYLPNPSFGCPICLSGDTMTNTPTGEINVKSLTPGEIVWTVDSHGVKVEAPIIRIGKTLVPATHQMVHLILADRRQLYASPGHPTTDGRTLSQLRVGDPLDGSVVTLAELTPYNQTYTYDLLPSGDTGAYWADGILLASTLK